MKVIKSVEPFKFTYRVLNRFERRSIGPFDSILDAYRAAYKKFGLTTYGEEISRISYYVIDGRVRFWNIEEQHAPRLAMLRVEDEVIVTPDEIKAVLPRYTSKWHNRNATKYERSRDLIYKKNHPAKLKEDYSSTLDVLHCGTRYGGDGSRYESYSICSNMSYHHIPRKVLGEKKHNELTDDYEDELAIFIHARRRFNLSIWNYESSTAAYNTYKSWKHNSKRRKQWIPK